jgi:hypothetical protein
MDTHYIDVTLFEKKKITQPNLFLGIKRVKEPQLIIVYITQPNLIQLFKLFRPTFCISTISFLNFIIVLIHKPFVTNSHTSTPCFPCQTLLRAVIPSSRQRSHYRFHTNNQPAWTKGIEIIPYNFLLENNVLEGFMYVRLYSYNNNHPICKITSHSIFHAKYAHVWPWGFEPATSGLTPNYPNHSGLKSLVTKGHKYSPRIHFTRYDYLRPK